jgi:hypothetical protein
MKPTDPMITVLGSKLGSSEKAVRFMVKEIVGISDPKIDLKSIQWFPYSQISKTFTDPNKVDQDYLIVSEWIIKQKQLDTQFAYSGVVGE